MAEVARHVPIDKNSELGKVLDDARATGQPVVLEVNGHSYRLMPQPRTAREIWSNYDPECVKRALAESAGAFKGMDTERLKRELRDQRGQDSPGRPA
jgi:hypothetical protein